MLSLKTVGRTFETPLQVVENGSGIISGVVTESPQNSVPSYIFVPARRVFRTKFPTALKPGHVIRLPTGEELLVGDNGSSEQIEGIIWKGFRLYEVTHKVKWTRRGKHVDPITKLEREGEKLNMGTISVAIEMTDREEFERKLHTSHEQARFISGADIRANDYLDDFQVIRSDIQLGLHIGMVRY